MATASVTNTFVDAATTSASAMNQNFTDVETFENSSTVHKDGSKSMSGDLDAGGFTLTGVAAPTVSTDAVTKDYVDGVSTGASFGLAVPFTPANQGTPVQTTAMFTWTTETDDVEGWIDVTVEDQFFTCPEGGIFEFRWNYSYSAFVTDPSYVLYYKRTGASNWYMLQGYNSFRHVSGLVETLHRKLYMTLDTGDMIAMGSDNNANTTTALGLKIIRLGAF